MSRPNLICHRALLVGNFTESFEQELVKLRMDRPLLRNISGIAAYRNGKLFGHADDVGFRVEADPPGLRILVDLLTDREKRVQHGEYELKEALLCLFVTTSQDSPEDIHHLWEEMMQVVPKERELHWLHLDASDGLTKQDLDGFWAQKSDVTQHVIKNQTASERIHFKEAEWAAAILQLQEFLMVQGAVPVELEKPEENVTSAYGFASIDFSQSDGKRLFYAQAFLDVLARENESVHLDEVFRICTMALKGGKEAYTRARFGIGDPADVDAYFTGDQGFEAFDAAEKMQEFRSQMLLPGGAVDKVQEAVGEVISDLANQIQTELNTRCHTTQLRLTAIRCLLGELGPHTHGKPMLPMTTLQDCEQRCLEAVQSIVQSGGGEKELILVPDLSEVHQQTLDLAGIREDIRNLEESIENAEKSNLTAESEKLTLQELQSQKVLAEASSRASRSEHHAARRKLYSLLSSNWLESRVEQIVADSQYIPPPPPEASVKGLSPFEKKALISSMSILTFAVILSFSWTSFDWLVPLVLWLGVGAFWAVLLYKRTRIRTPHVVDPMFAQRDLWRSQAIKLHDLLVSFAAVQRFEDFFDDVIRMPLQRQAQQLEASMQAFREHESVATDTVNSCFTSVRFVEQLGDKTTFNHYYNQSLRSSISSAPVFYDAITRQQAAGSPWDVQDYLEHYLNDLEAHVQKEMNQLDDFDMVEHLLSDSADADIPLFLQEGMSDLDELMRRSRIRLEILFNKRVKLDRLVILHDALIPSVSLERLKTRLAEYWEEAKKKQLEFVETDDANRISFVRIAQVIPEKSGVRASRTANRTREAE